MVRLIALFVFSGIAMSCSKAVNEISLAGKWELSIDSISDPHKVDPESLSFNLVINLPSTLDEAGIGTPVKVDPVLERNTMLHLQRKVSYIGPAYYRKEVSIPKSWEGKHISLKLERVLWESLVYVDGKKIDNNYSLSAPHYYDLSSSLSPGKHTLTVCVDNSRKFILNRSDMAHAYTEETQIKWNGILGEISLNASSQTYISEMMLYPDYAGRSLTGKVKSNLTAENPHFLYIQVFDERQNLIDTSTIAVTGGNTGFKLSFSGDIRPWDEFNPTLYKVVVSLSDKNGLVLDVRQEEFGFRDLESRNRNLYLNGSHLYLRGTLECSIFPLTGHPPLDVEGWEKVYTAAREYGLNHLRFHSWCPPKAAFVAADKMGIYLQVELPNWSLDFGADMAMVNFMNEEADRIIAEYGGHPSFMLMSMGNELEGNFELLTGMVARLKNSDPRHIYTTTTYSFQKGHGLYPETIDDFYITQNTEKGWARGQGVFDQLFPDFKTDYTNAIDHIEIPVISHEIGQYSVYPDMNEIEKYTGVLSPVNFIAVKNDLERKGLSDLADKYTAASGKFATILYKEEIERAVKTPGLSGFQLLDLHDFPGQGTALVGVLNAFWESKGFVSGEDWRMFCSEMVPLLWFEKAVYTSNELFTCEFGLANYYKNLSNISMKWRVLDEGGKVYLEDSARVEQNIKGVTSKLGTLSIPLKDLPAPAKYTLELSLEGTAYKNQWSIWVYPPDVKMPETDIVVTSLMSDAVKSLEQGKKVLFTPDLQDIVGITGKFVPVFWSPVHFPDQPGTMGLLMDPEHPAFNSFPTDFHTNWQWWDLCKNSKTLILDSLTVDPIVMVIDNFFKNRKLGNVFEAKVGNGKLVFSSIDLHSDLAGRPVARQLKHSLLEYMNSSDFDPESEIKLKDINRLLSITISVVH